MCSTAEGSQKRLKRRGESRAAEFMRPLDRLHIYFPRNAVSQACLAAAEQFVQFVVVHARQHVASDGPAILANIAAGQPSKAGTTR